MKWNRGYQSDDVEVRRGSSGGGGGGGGLPVGILSLIASRFGIGGVVIAVLAFGAFQFFGSRGADDGAGAGDPVAAKSDERVQFASFVLDDVQRTWAKTMPNYQHAKLVLFRGGTTTACGYGERAVGPFYCPRDSNVYLDLDFFRTLEQKLGAGGDFAQAYVIAHEIGHHVQNQLGLSDKLGGATSRGAHGTSVKIELQADCYAGVWAHSTEQRNLLEAGDIEEALTAASSIGDDRLQQQSQGTVQPENWTHGSSAQRVEWFRRGLKSGDRADCDTFKTAAR